MGKCDWCGRSYRGGFFSDYCSKKCESEAEDKGKKKSLGCLPTILILIVGFALNIIKECNPQKQIKKENKVIKIEKQKTISHINEEKNSSIEITTSKENTDNVKNKIISNNDLVNSNNHTTHQVKIEKAIDMLKQKIRVSKIADSLSLSRKEIRQLKRKLRKK